MKVTTFAAFDKQGNRYQWAFYRDQEWMLRDYTGYVRTLGKTWIDSAPKINLILDNHGMSANIS